MTDEQRLKALEKLIECSFSLQLNMNDVFYYSTGDISDLPSEDALDLLEYVAEYGDEVFTAYEAITRGHDPQIKKHVTSNFIKVKGLLITRMKEDENFLCELNYKIRKKEKEISLYGGILSYKWHAPTIWQKFKGKNNYICECSCEGRIEVGYGDCIKDATDDFIRQI